MDNPYDPPVARIFPPTPTAFQWKRVVVWALGIYAATLIAGFAFSLLDPWRLFHATDAETYLAMIMMVRYSIYFIVETLLMWRFASGTRDRPLLHVVATVALVHLIQSAIDYFMVGKPIWELMRPSLTGRLLLAAAIGLGMAGIRRTTRP